MIKKTSEINATIISKKKVLRKQVSAHRKNVMMYNYECTGQNSGNCVNCGNCVSGCSGKK